MRIAHIIAGSGGGFYCENCVRDGALVRALTALGHEALAVPLYLPLPQREFGAPRGRVFYGAVSLYLSETVPLLKGMPSWLEGILDSRPALALASRLSGSTSPVGLADLTLSMLSGESDYLRRKQDALVAWLKREARPDIVHLSNALLIGIAGRLRAELGVPVTVSLQDEDTWIDALPPRAATEAWSLMKRGAAWIDLFLPVSAAYARLLASRLDLDSRRVRVVPIGIDAERYRQSLPTDPPVIGYLSRLSRDMGFGVLAEAFTLLRSMPGMGRVRLEAMGGCTAEDTPFLRAVFAALERAGLLGEVEIKRGFSLEDRVRFLSGISVLSVPAPRGEAFGTFLMEASAAGVPAVQPRAGAFAEILEATGGGVLTEDASPLSIARAIAELLSNAERARALGQSGRREVRARFGMADMARATLEAFERAMSHGRAACL